MSPGKRFWIFLKECYEPGLHIAFAGAWYLGLLGALSLSDGRATRFNHVVCIGIVSNFLVLFFLRILDEIKDYDYDVRHNPERPLVRGVVSHRDLQVYLSIVATLVVAINLLLPSSMLGLAAADLAYATLLLWLERKFPALGDRMLLNLIFTYPVNVALSFYIYLGYLNSGSVAGLGFGHGLVLVGFIFAFLHYEFARKTLWPEDSPPGKRLYSSSLGTRLSALLSGVFALGAVTVVTAAIGPGAGLVRWATVLALVPVGLGLKSFMTRQKSKLTGFAMQFLILFYGITTLIGLFIRV